MSDGYNTKTRRAVIRRLIAANRISTQTELSERLEEEGLHATQATISRDIRELHLIKVTDKKGKYYTFTETNEELVATSQFQAMYRNLSLKSSRAQNLIVIRTAPGMAQALCAVMDKMDWKSVLGTLAGDDTVLLIAENDTAAEGIMEVLAGI